MFRHLAALLALTPLLFSQETEIPATLELVESWPIETTLDHADLRDTSEVWSELFRGASKSIDLEHFYLSIAPAEYASTGRLSKHVEELIDAAKSRGVAVRIVADAGFHRTYPETLDLLDAVEGIEVRLLDLKERTGGVQHAKFALIDGLQTFLGSPNFDWRSLEHIQELSALITSSDLTAFYASVFELDWRMAGGEKVPEADTAIRSGSPAPTVTLSYRGQDVQATPVASPKGLLPCAHDECWDLPRLVELIDGAKDRVRLQLLSYKPAYRNRTYFAELDNALRRAATRRVNVELMFANWSQTRGRIEALKSLQVLPNVEVKIVTMPQWSGGFIDFGRVVHSKYLVADGKRAWIGTSNGSGDYFTASRNVGLVVEGEAFGSDLDRYFEKLWSSEAYAKTVDPCAEYKAPQRSR